MMNIYLKMKNTNFVSHSKNIKMIIGLRLLIFQTAKQQISQILYDTKQAQETNTGVKRKLTVVTINHEYSLILDLVKYIFLQLLIHHKTK